MSPKFIFAFKDLADQLGSEIVGEPLEDQDENDYDGFGNVIIFTTKGIMIYKKEINKAHFLPAVLPAIDSIVRAIDVSSWQPRDLTELIAKYTPEHVVVRMYLPQEWVSQNHSREQVASALVNGCSVGAYMWAYRDFDPIQSIKDALTLAKSCGLNLKVLWIDCETFGTSPGPDIAWLQSAVAECERQNVRAGVYSGLWWVQQYLHDWSEFIGLPLWLAQYDGKPTFDNVLLPDGWQPEMLWGKQYQGENIDLNIFRRIVL